MGLFSIECHRLDDNDLHDSTKNTKTFALPAHKEMYYGRLQKG